MTETGDNKLSEKLLSEWENIIKWQESLSHHFRFIKFSDKDKKANCFQIYFKNSSSLWMNCYSISSIFLTDPGRFNYFDFQRLISFIYHNKKFKDIYSKMFFETTAYYDHLPKWHTNTGILDWELKFNHYHDRGHSNVNINTISVNENEEEDKHLDYNYFPNSVRTTNNDSDHDDFWLKVAYIILISTSKLELSSLQPVFSISLDNWTNGVIENIVNLCPSNKQNLGEGYIEVDYLIRKKIVLDDSIWPCNLICFRGIDSPILTKILLGQPLLVPLKANITNYSNHPLLVVLRDKEKSQFLNIVTNNSCNNNNEDNILNDFSKENENRLNINNIDVNVYDNSRSRSNIHLNHPQRIISQNEFIKNVTNTLERFMYPNCPKLTQANFPKLLLGGKQYSISIISQFFPNVLAQIIYEFGFPDLSGIINVRVYI